MPAPIPIFATIIGASALYAAACTALVKAAFFDTRNASRATTAAFLCVCFVFLVASCSILNPISQPASACASALICACSIAAAKVVERRLHEREVRDVIRVRRADRMKREHQALERERNSLPAVCAKVARSYDLTRKEETVLALLLRGKTQAEISRDLTLSPNTVKTHARSIYRKLDVHSRQELHEAIDGVNENRGEEGAVSKRGDA